MASSKTPFVISSSPNTSDEAESHHGSPETKVTAFSPEEERSPKQSATGVQGNEKEPPTFSLDQTHYQLPSYLNSPHIWRPANLQLGGLSSFDAMVKDPFGGSSLNQKQAIGNNCGQKLSPTASSFTPVSAYARRDLSQGQQSQADSTADPTNPRTDSAGANESQLKSYLKTVVKESTQAQSNGRHPLTLKPETVSDPARNVSIQGAVKVVQALVIHGVDPGNTAYLLNDLFNHHILPLMEGPAQVAFDATGAIYLGFSSIRDCGTALQKTRGLHSEWRIEYCSPSKFAQTMQVTSPATPRCRGQVLLKIYFSGTKDAFLRSPVQHIIMELLSNYGDIREHQNLEVREPGLYCKLVTYYDPAAAALVAKTLDGFSIQGCYLSITCSGSEPVSPHRHEPAAQAQRGVEVDLEHLNLGPRRVSQGEMVPTTIMLRNIPNKIDQKAMLKEIVDETSAGKYDFMYLRIDFANNCNVGYAFINFEDPFFIIDFVQARAGLRWNRFNSDKVAEVSYATIQGKDCLVQKFRNSSVMLEHPSFRPKLFHTGTGPLAGQEDTFPGPDNPSKMRRSVENAEHVGLFAPRAGQHNRDEMRRRRSQYDRGTRLAEMEEAYEFDAREEEDFYREQAFRLGSFAGPRYGLRPSRFDLGY
ncbi:MAG: hypothetical protein M1817_006536 [Caeruleum heppii]|nr:MAG: hypothetical protein M1817_006536 [Caeruleum heppii]